MAPRRHRVRSLVGPVLLGPVLLGLALVAVLSFPAPARAATVVERSLSVTIEPDGEVVEHERLRIRLEHRRDLELVSPYVVLLDENRDLDDLEAWIETEDGDRDELDNDRFEEADLPLPGVLHSSRRVHLVRFPAQPPGTVVGIESRVEVEPWFESGVLGVADELPVERLEIEIQGDGLRWHLAGRAGAEAAGLLVEERDGGLRISGRWPGLGDEDDPQVAPVLHYAWGPVRTWDDLGGWYRGLTASVPRAEEEVQTMARELVAQGEGPSAGASGVAPGTAPDRATGRRAVEALTRFVRTGVRYVAVEVGIGGYRPSPPLETLERRWGDCKDKSFLLADLLAEAGIPAHPALVLADEGRRIEAEFPSLAQFNHMIVAIPADAIETTASDAVAGGYLFIDPTQTLGGLSWLHPGVQGQDALVIRPEGSQLVSTPVAVDGERTVLRADLTVAPDGSAQGRVNLHLSGRGAWHLGEVETMPGVDLEEAVRARLERWLPRADLTGLTFGRTEVEGLPVVEMDARVSLPRFVRRGASPSVRLPWVSPLPSPRRLDGGGGGRPLPLDPGITETLWTLRLPADGCRPEPAETTVETVVGDFVERLEVDGDGVVRVLRRARVSARWAQGETERAAARTLVHETRRAVGGRLRLECSEPEG